MYTGVSAPFTYRLWDASMNTKCTCDAGYSGPDCSLRTCPLGSDPLTVLTSQCGNKACVKETQGFTINGASTNDGKTYSLTFYDFYGTAYDTNAFTILTSSGTAASRNAANALAVKSALESIPGAVTGNVTVSSTSDLSDISGGAGTSFNVRITVTFTTLTGNIEPMFVTPVTGTPVVTQPSAVTHVFTLTTNWGAGTPAISFQVFPDDFTGFRTAQFLTTGPVTLAALTANSNLVTASKAALHGAGVGISAFIYKFGTATQVSGSGVSTGTSYLVVTLPSAVFGKNPIKLTVGSSTPVLSVVDTIDGNLEASQCSNRGLCNQATGLCACFPGYTGNACGIQNALAR